MLLKEFDSNSCVGNYIQSLDMGDGKFFELNLVLLAFIFKKNIKLFYL